MGKYDNEISEAKTLISDVYKKAGNYGLVVGNLKLNSFINRLQTMIKSLENENLQKPRGFAGKLKNAVFGNSKEPLPDKKAVDIAEMVYRIDNCLKCKCSNCVNISAECGCEGCSYGSFVIECDTNTEIRFVDIYACSYNGRAVYQTTYYRKTKSLYITHMDENGIEQTYLCIPIDTDE